MSLLKFITFLYFLISTCLLQSHFGASNLYYFCSTSGNFTSNDPFDINSKELMGYFNYGMEKKDFALGSKGHGQDQVHSLLGDKQSFTLVRNGKDHEYIRLGICLHWYETFWGITQEQIYEGLVPKWTISYQCGDMLCP